MLETWETIADVFVENFGRFCRQIFRVLLVGLKVIALWSDCVTELVFWCGFIKNDNERSWVEIPNLIPDVLLRLESHHPFVQYVILNPKAFHQIREECWVRHEVNFVVQCRGNVAIKFLLRSWWKYKFCTIFRISSRKGVESYLWYWGIGSGFFIVTVWWTLR